VEIELLYVPGCPNREVARRHLAVALARTERAAVIHEREVRSAEEAANLAMRGSPTILVDGEDPFDGESSVVALSCRLYPPTIEQLVEVLGR
jgi:hypothetical protein